MLFPRLHALLGNLVADAPKYVPVAIAVGTGIASILIGNVPGGVIQLLHAVTILAAGWTVVGLHQAVARVPQHMMTYTTKGEE
jgi:hypothetical protein